MPNNSNPTRERLAAILNKLSGVNEPETQRASQQWQGIKNSLGDFGGWFPGSPGQQPQGNSQPLVMSLLAPGVNQAEAAVPPQAESNLMPQGAPSPRNAWLDKQMTLLYRLGGGLKPGLYDWEGKRYDKR